jgi:hypothetical protein
MGEAKIHSLEERGRGKKLQKSKERGAQEREGKFQRKRYKIDA